MEMIYDILEDKVHTGQSVYFSLLMSLGFITIFFVSRKIKMLHIHPFGYMILIFGAITGVLLSISTALSAYQDHRNQVDNLRRGNFIEVCGLVSNYIAASERSKLRESFSVDGKHFTFSEFRIQPGYRGGGSISNGQSIMMRISNQYVLQILNVDSCPQK
jgi:tellurite resistance protein TehA-like permease